MLGAGGARVTLSPVWPVIPAMGVLMLGMLAATYAVSYENEKKHPMYTIPFISSSINFSPASNIGGFGISVIMLAFVPILFCKYVLLRGAIEETEASRGTYGELRSLCVALRTWNTVSLFFGFAAAIGVLGVGACEYHELPVAHLCFAFLFFGGSVVYLLMVARLDWALKHAGTPVWARWLRLVMAVLELVCFPLFVGLMERSKSNSYDSVNLYQSLSAGFEIACLSTIFFFVMSYAAELRSVRFHVVAERVGGAPGAQRWGTIGGDSAGAPLFRH